MKFKQKMLSDTHPITLIVFNYRFDCIIVLYPGGFTPGRSTNLRAVSLINIC